MAKISTTNPIILGRKEECDTLQNAFESTESKFVSVCGRRRIGKTFLVKTYYANHIVFEFTGVNNTSMAAQLQSFYEAVCAKDKKLTLQPVPKTWFEAFWLLQSYLKGIKTKKKKVVFLDEVPWIGTAKSDFIMALGYFWNSYAGWTRDIILVIAGSTVSWIVNNVMRNIGGLYHRLTDRVWLEPFTLQEVNSYLKTRGAKYTNHEVLQLYMVMGGVPRYLKEIDIGLSVAQNIEQLCFTKDGLLYNEFKNLYAALFKNADNHLAVVTALATKNKGLTRNEIVKATKFKSGGTLSAVLTELIECGFVKATYPFENKTKEQLYRLSDEYSVFYIRFIANASLQQKDYWLHIACGQSYKTWCGYAFEGICIKHVQQIKAGLGISGMYVAHSCFVHKGKEYINGVQIELILDRPDGHIHLCEIKYCAKPYTITKAIDMEWRNKRGNFDALTKTKKGVHTTTITTHGITPNMYQFSADYNLTANMFFVE